LKGFLTEIELRIELMDVFVDAGQQDQTHDKEALDGCFSHRELFAF
jgi:hypothetical protein